MPVLALTALLAVAAALPGPARAVESRQAHQRTSPNFTFYYDSDRIAEVESVQLAAEEAFWRISERLRFKPTERIPVYIYKSRGEFVRNARVNRTEFVVGTASSADHAIRLDGSRLLSTPAKVVGHEVAHIFLFRMLGNRVGELPLWMNEGLAQELGGEDRRHSHSTVETALYERRLPELSSLAEEFPEASDDSSLAYAQAQDAVGVLLERGGWEKMRALLIALKEGGTFDGVLKDLYGHTAASWDREWMRTVRAEARRHAWMQVASWVVPLLMFIALGWGTLTVRRKRLRQVEEEAEPVGDLEPPTWWREDEFRT